MKKYLPYLLLVIVIIILIVRELSHSKYTQKEALKLQSEKNKTAWAAKQIQESKEREDQWVNIAGNAKKDVARLEEFVKYYKLKSIENEKKDRITIRNYTPTQLDSIFAKRYPKPDSVYFKNPTPGVN